jgi:acyl dehydratase
LASFSSSTDATTADSMVGGDASVEAITGTISEGGADVRVGQHAKAVRAFSAGDVRAFARVSGDANPLHASWIRHDPSAPDWIAGHALTQWTTTAAEDGEDDNNDKDKEKGGERRPQERSRVVVHGMLVASLFTRILGTRIPGCVYLNQTLEFVRPVYALQPVEGTVTVTGIEPWRSSRGESDEKGQVPPSSSGRRVLTCDTVVRLAETNKVCVRGQAQVLLLPPSAGRPAGSE